MYWYPKGLRGRILEVARGELGQDDANFYWDEVLGGGPPYPPAWCGGFTLWVLRHAGFTDQKWEIGRGFLSDRFHTTRDPKPGDVAYIDQPFQHHAIVEFIDGNDVHLIAGNTPTDDVARQVYPRSRVVFYSVEPFVTYGPTFGRIAMLTGIGGAGYLFWKNK